MGQRVPNFSKMRVCRGLILALVVAGLGLLTGARPADADVVNNLILIEDDGTILEPADPLPLGGHRVVLTPAAGGYTSRVEPGVVPAALGARLALGAPDEPAHVPLVRPVSMYGQFHQDLFIHPHGAISFGAPLPEGAGAWATDSADWLAGLVAGPPVLAVLWNELRPNEGSTPGAGVYIAELPDRVVVTWARVPSARPAGQPNTFRAVLHRNGFIELEYPRVSTGWGIVGLSPGSDRVGTDIVDLVTEPDILPGRALFSWYRDRPRLNEVALARRVYTEAPDRFDFLAVFTDRVVEGSHLVGSVTVANDVQGIGMPIFDHAQVFGSRKLEHIVLMNSLSFYDDDPTKSPRIPSYAYSPSTLAVLGHELGHRWLAQAGEPLVAPGRRGHWNYFLDSGGSFMGGSSLTENADGTFTTDEVMSRFGALDQYLMGIRPADEVDDFFVVERPWGVDETASAAPSAGLTFAGERRDLSVDDVIEQLGERTPIEDGVRTFQMGFVLVVPQGVAPAQADVNKLQRVRRGFGPYFRAATDGRARVRTWMPRGTFAQAAPIPAPLPRNPFILGVDFRAADDGTTVASVDFLDVGGDLLELELSTDASIGVPPSSIDLAPAAFGNLRGTVSFALRHIPAGATEIHLALVDSTGLRSETYAVPIPESMSET
ncbi:MAG: hypothetical protein P8R42_26610 [Candidatus Binatia bacterium]|nr:hypothetical protein [Candidatus Binatia bacterium]